MNNATIPNCPILNRAGKLPDDGWYDIETPGEHFNPEAKVVQLLDEKAFTAIANRFAAQAAGSNFGGLLIDQDHFSLDPEKSSEAFGWLLEVRNRAGQPLQGRVDWTDLGEPAVTKKRYKFFSTVYEPKNVEVVGKRVIEGKTYPLVRPLALDRLALTNDPNNKGGKPISNRKGGDAGADHPVDITRISMKNVNKELGLAEDAIETSAVAEIQKIKNRASTAETERDALKKDNEALLTSQVASDLEKYKNRFKPENREKIKAQLIKNRAGTIELLESTEAPAAEELAADPEKITNRSKAKTPAEIAADAGQQAEEERAARILNRANQMVAQEKIQFPVAFERAEAAEPAAKR